MNDPLLSPLAPLPKRCLVGVSGGVDSIALLHALVSAGKEPIVLHFNHAWRGAESAADAAFVRDVAKRLKLKFITATARATTKKTEQHAREVRWEFFAKTAAKLRCRELVLAHHADDQVETFLLQLLRGSGSGARGMRAVTKRGTLTIHRPWLGVWRKEIVAYARRQTLDWREDASNRDTHHRRNRLRHRLLPYLQKHFSPDAPRALWRAAEILGAEGEWLDALVDSGPDPREAQLPVRALRVLPVAQVRRILRAWLTHHKIPDIGFDDVESVRGLLTQTLPARVNLPANHIARRRAGMLSVQVCERARSAR